MSSVLVAAAVAVSAVTSGLSPSLGGEGNPQRGQVLAQTLCASCHVAEGAGTDIAPTLQAVARGKSDEALRASIANPHHAYMPPLDLSRRDIDDIVAYLHELRQP